MRIQLASDLHLEFVEGAFPGERLIAPAYDADLLVLAGDIAEGARAVELFAQWPVPVLYVAGNHEFYGYDWERMRLDLRAAVRGTSVVFLDNDVADLTVFEDWCASRQDELTRIRFLGTTLWTDYRYAAAGRTQRQLMDEAEQRIVDHREICTQEGPFRAEHALRDHELSRHWLERRLAEPFDGKTVVITHHGPHPLSVHPRYLTPSTLAVNAAFVSDLSPLLCKADVWLHGHVHDSFNYEVEGCRIVANPRGYPRNRNRASKPSELEFENQAFQSACVVDI